MEAERAVTAATKETVYLFFDNSMGSMAHTLFAIPVPNFDDDPCNDNVKPQPERRRLVEPIIEFPASKYPRMMACAKLGSKIYFLGGERWPRNEEQQPREIYPPHVYVYDEIGGAVVKKLKAGMHAGKPFPVAFVADGKLFVLGSCGGPNLISFPSLKPTQYPTSSLNDNFFEVYDPATNHWRLLDNPPVSVPTIWLNSPVVMGRKVYLYGQFLGRCRGILLSFDLDSYQWSEPSKPSQDVNFLTLRRAWYKPAAQLIGDSLYGLAPKGSGVVRQRLEPVLQDEQLLFRLPFGGAGSSTSFCHLGHRLFCSVATGSMPDPLVPLHYGMLDQNRRYISLRLHRELEIPEEPHSTVELLYSADYLFQSTYSSFGTLLGCFPSHHSIPDVDVVPSEEKKEEAGLLEI